jgi:UDP-N-acetylglucosamine 2-epimerase
MARHVLIVVGTRPEAIKMIPVVQAGRAAGLNITLAVTGQHRHMLRQVFEAFGETPDVDLDLMTAGQTLPQLTALVLTEMSQVIERLSPDIVLVHGDTTTAMASCLAAFYARVPVGHVEAGLRSFDLDRPWPEEFNRVAVDCLAEWMFAPTKSAAENLASEYGRSRRIYVTGNTGIDALLSMSARLDADAGRSDEIAARCDFLDPSRRLILVTGHRRESFGGGFERICEALARLAARPDVQILYPVHLNPNVRGVVHERLGSLDNLFLIEPVDYVDMVYLMKRAAILLTDSGGIQEEGPALGKPVLVMRDVTERPEALDTDVVRLVGTDVSKIVAEVSCLLDDAGEYRARARAVFPYGDGTAARQIVEILGKVFSA